MAITNTGIVERTIVGVHDANFVRPLGDEEVLNGDFSNGSTDWTVNAGIAITDKANFNSVSGAYISQDILTTGKSYKLTFDITDYTSGDLTIYGGAVNTISTGYSLNAVGSYTIYFASGGLDNQIYFGNSFIGSIDNISIKEMLVNRESTATNTGIVERSILGVHDANFVRPLGDEEITNGDFSNGGTDWNLTRGNVISNELVFNTTGAPSGSRSVFAIQNNVADLTKVYKVQFTVSNYVSGQFRLRKPFITNDTFGNGTYTYYGTAIEINFELQGRLNIEHDFTLDNVSVKEMLVNRESTATNTGIVERPITGVNESDPMFPDNTISTIINI